MQAANLNRDITDSRYLFTSEEQPVSWERLPVSFPYLQITGQAGDGTVLTDPITFSELTTSDRQQMTISLKKSSDNSMVLSHTYDVSELHNTPLEIIYS